MGIGKIPKRSVSDIDMVHLVFKLQSRLINQHVVWAKSMGSYLTFLTMSDWKKNKDKNKTPDGPCFRTRIDKCA